jgi:DNA/RNA-binding domain of Phe-tRNA-synthetase-like protein
LDEQIKKIADNNNLEEPLVQKWDNIHRKFGSNPNKFPPSIKSLLKRVQKRKPLPFINSIVAVF